MTLSLPFILCTPTTFRLQAGGEAVVSVTNKEVQPITFKIKTTTPARYIVRPRIGVILSNETIHLTIQHRFNDLSMGTASPHSLTVIRDRFKVEAVFLPEECPVPLFSTSASAQRAGSKSATEGEKTVPTLQEQIDASISQLWTTKPRSKEVELQCSVILRRSSIESLTHDHVPMPNTTAYETNAINPNETVWENRLTKMQHSEKELREKFDRLEEELKTERARWNQIANQCDYASPRVPLDTEQNTSIFTILGFIVILLPILLFLMSHYASSALRKMTQITL